MYICMYIHVYVYYIHIYIYICTYIQMTLPTLAHGSGDCLCRCGTFIFGSKGADIHTYIQTYIYIYIYK